MKHMYQSGRFGVLVFKFVASPSSGLVNSNLVFEGARDTFCCPNGPANFHAMTQQLSPACASLSARLGAKNRRAIVYQVEKSLRWVVQRA
jgi:hypothetical protein